jgi:hypothetical protein
MQHWRQKSFICAEEVLRNFQPLAPRAMEHCRRFEAKSGIQMIEYDEWNQDRFDEWQAPVDVCLRDDLMSVDFRRSSVPCSPTPGAFPEVEIGLSSDEDAPPSAQLARENHQLRTRVNALVAQSTSVEQRNASLKQQLGKYRHSFASRIKSLFK